MAEIKQGDPENTASAEPPPYSPPTAMPTAMPPAMPPAMPTAMPPAMTTAAPYPPPNSTFAYPPPTQPGFSPAIYQTTPPQNDAIVRSTQHQTVTTTQVMVGVPTCPQCRVGTLQDTFTPLGICCAIFLFPIGLLFCLMMKRQQCAQCGAIYM